MILNFILTSPYHHKKQAQGELAPPLFGYWLLKRPHITRGRDATAGLQLQLVEFCHWQWERQDSNRFGRVSLRARAIASG